MQKLRKLCLPALVLFFGPIAISAGAVALPSAWQRQQLLEVPALGVFRLDLPVETLDSARPGLEDLRLYDPAGREVPYWMVRPPQNRGPAVRRRDAKSFHVTMRPRATEVLLETGFDEAIDGVTLASPAHDFIKAVKIEGSTDRQQWHTMGEGQPVFRQPDGAAQLHLSFPAGVWKWIRLTVDDRRSQSIPWTGAIIEATPTAAEVVNLPWTQAAIAERDENPGETRLTLDLGAANLDLHEIQIETGATLFARRVRLAVAQASEYGISEETLAQGTIFRVAIESGHTAEELTVPLHTKVRARQLLLFVNNGDAPPLAIRAVRFNRRPVQILFLGQQPGSYHVLTGNSRCAAPSYDSRLFSLNPEAIPPVSPLTLTLPAANPDYRAPDVLPGIGLEAAPLDVSEWEYRKPVQISRDGAQQLELDLDTLAHAQPGLRDIRLLRDGKQIPFVIENTSIVRTVPASATPSTDATDARVTRWTMAWPHVGLPVTGMACTVRTPLFQREMTLYQELEDERGNSYRDVIAQGQWLQTPGHTNTEFALPITQPLRRDRLFLETHNGDNPPIDLQDVRFFYPVTRLLFKSSASAPVFLYYGNHEAEPPSYDISLVMDQLLQADKTPASLAAEERLRASAPHSILQSGSGTVALWGVLALVVVVLLWLIARLLPKPAQESPKP